MYVKLKMMDWKQVSVGTVVIALSFILCGESLAQRNRMGLRGQNSADNLRILPPENTMARSGYATNEVEPAPILHQSQALVYTTMKPPVDTDMANVSLGELTSVRKPSLGALYSAEVIQQSINEVRSGFQRRSGVQQRFDQWIAYMGSSIRSTAGDYTGSEVNGLGRLTWWNELMLNPLSGPGQTDVFTREMHKNLCMGKEYFNTALKLGMQKMDLTGVLPAYQMLARDPNQAISLFVTALERAKLHHARAIEPLTQSELMNIRNYSYSVLTVNTSVGHTVSMRSSARTQLQAMRKLDRSEFYAGLAELSFLMDPAFINLLTQIPDTSEKIELPVFMRLVQKKEPENKDGAESVELEKSNSEDSANVDIPQDEPVMEKVAPPELSGITGSVVSIFETQSGTVIIGGRGPNTYDLEKMPTVCAIIELGGDDTYIDGAVTLDRPLLVLMDLDGNDTYRGTKPNIQGASTLGISVLVDVKGDDSYNAQHFAQGSTVAGAALLADLAGNDLYIGQRRVQGTALAGVGILMDRGGDDKYRGAMWTQGFGQSLGLGILEDVSGDDAYYTGGMYYDSYPETPGYEGWGQGIGSGIRGVAAGGIGLFLEGEGQDVYEYDYIAHGGGYWMGIGLFRDFAGNDRHLGSTSVMWNGSPRREGRYQRFSTGFGCHYAAGFFFEDSGDDEYYATIMSQGFAWDCGVAFLYDFGGNDTWTATGAGNHGQGAQASFGMLFDYKGNDKYIGTGQGYASGNITYHQYPHCGGNFSFLIDYGGEDKYGCGAKNNSYSQRGVSSGFLIDRPDVSELSDKIATPVTLPNAVSSLQSAELE